MTSPETHAKKVALNLQSHVLQTQGQIFTFISNVEDALDNGVPETETTPALTAEQVRDALGELLPKLQDRIEVFRKAATS